MEGCAYSELMYEIVFSRRGMTTCSSAFTRRLVILMTSSRMTNAVLGWGAMARSASCAPRAPEGVEVVASLAYLERGELDQGFDSLGKRFPALFHLLPSPAESGQPEACATHPQSDQLARSERRHSRSPRPRPDSLPPSVSLRRGSNVGRMVPETFSCLVWTLNVAAEMDSWIWYEMSPEAYVTSASEKAASCITRPILRLA